MKKRALHIINSLWFIFSFHTAHPTNFKILNGEKSVYYVRVNTVNKNVNAQIYYDGNIIYKKVSFSPYYSQKIK